MKRFWQVDFLRGVAIVMVLLRHCDLSTFTNNIGWIGVDLFFVLSGFLIANLLLEEYKETNTINLKYFFIRRAIKVYPLFYLVLSYYVVYTILHNSFQWNYFFAELFFYQNYLRGWGWAMYGGSWSLAVEEHFYFSIILFIAFLFFLKRKKNQLYYILLKGKYHIVICMIVFVFLSRIITFYYTNVPLHKQFTMTHLRFDAILWGILLALLYNFKHSKFIAFFKKFKIPLLLFSLFTILSFGFLDDINTAYIHVVGFIIVDFSFFVLVGLSFSFDLNFIKNSKFNKVLVGLGLASYSIYITHPYLIQFRYALKSRILFVKENELLISCIAFFVYIIFGYAVYYFIERKILRWKNRFKATVH